MQWIQSHAKIEFYDYGTIHEMKLNSTKSSSSSEDGFTCTRWILIREYIMLKSGRRSKGSGKRTEKRWQNELDRFDKNWRKSGQNYKTLKKEEALM